VQAQFAADLLQLGWVRLICQLRCPSQSFRCAELKTRRGSKAVKGVSGIKIDRQLRQKAHGALSGPRNRKRGVPASSPPSHRGLLDAGGRCFTPSDERIDIIEGSDRAVDRVAYAADNAACRVLPKPERQAKWRTPRRTKRRGKVSGHFGEI